MNFVYKDYEYLPDVDVLIKVYKNQEDICCFSDRLQGEIISKHGEVIKFHSGISRGLANAIYRELRPFQGKDWKVQISNELPDEFRQVFVDALPFALYGLETIPNYKI